MSFFSKFRDGLKKTAVSITRGITGIFKETAVWDDAAFKKLENTLVEADFGMVSAKQVTEAIRDRYQKGELSGSDDMARAAGEAIAGILKASARPLAVNKDGLTVILFVGVNGTGKTTTIGKLACRWEKEGKKVMLAACDTFRAAAVEQLKLWADRSHAGIVSSKQGADPSAVAYDAVTAALARKADFLLIDTAGRQHTQKNLMDELAKLKRTVSRLCPGAPHEVLLTIDSSIGTNAVIQCREFSAIAEVTGLVLTKMDGTGKGGAATAIQSELKLPVLFAGLGEQPDDLKDFDPDEYAQALFSAPDDTEQTENP